MVKFAAVVVLLASLAPEAAAKTPLSIEIRTTYFGRLAELRQIKGGVIHVETFLRHKAVKVHRKLTSAERSKLDAFMKSFPLRRLKASYVSKTRGESSTTYQIRYGKLRKTIFQYFSPQKDLTALSQLVSSLAQAKQGPPHHPPR